MSDRSTRGRLEHRIAHIAIHDPVPAYRIGLSAVLQGAGYRVKEPRNLKTWLRSAKPLAVVFAITDSADFAQASSLTEIKPDLTVVTLLPAGDPTYYADAIDRSLFPVLREASEEIIVSVVDTAFMGHVMLPRFVARTLMAGKQPRRRNGLGISPEHQTWLQHLADGMSVESLAEATGYSRRELFRRLRRLYVQLGASNRSQALVIATERSIIAGRPGK